MRLHWASTSPGSASGDAIEAGQLIWGAPAWVVPAVVIGLAVAALVVWSYVRGRQIGPVGWIAAGLKLFAVALIALCLLEPMRSGTRPRPRANVLPIVVDNSQSMKLRPRAGDLSRGERISGLLDPDSAWRTRLDQDFDVRGYAFDARLQAIDQFSDLTFDGHASSLVSSLCRLRERFADRPVGGVLLFTDGNPTDLSGATADWSEFGFPVYPVIGNDPLDLPDLRIADVSVRQTDFESAPLTVQVGLDAVSIGDEPVVVELFDLAANRRVEEQTVSLGGSEQRGSVRFRFRPQQPGVGFFRVTARLERDRGSEETGGEAEVTLENNARLIAVDRAQGPYRVLYVAGRPNWEFKFLRRALEADAEVQLVGLLRMAKEEPKFSFRDRGVSSTNPLFAGLGDDEEEAAEQYDEPVIIRLGVRESEELSEGFPDTEEELFSYQGLILDDLEPGFFTHDQMLLIRRFVAARGGGLLMLGGQESFAGRRFGETPLGELSPAYAPRLSERYPSGAYRMELTREGMLQPWIRLRDNESAEVDRLRDMPPFSSVNPLGNLKPGASALATVQDGEGQELIAIAAQRFGRGRTAAIAVADLWRWSMRRQDEDRDDPAQAWRQITHWLVNEVPRRAEVRVEPGEDPSHPVRIVATARDEAYLPLDNARVELEVTPLSGEPFTLIAQPDGDEAGIYSASYWAKEPGVYRVEAKIKAADGSDVGTAKSGWATDPAAAEFRALRVNRELLATIAEQTGGEVVAEEQLNDFVADLPDRKVPVMETWVFPIWHRLWVMLAAMLCLCAEWGLRRWKGLP